MLSNEVSNILIRNANPIGQFSKSEDNLINSSIIHDRSRFVPKLSNNTNLTNNYAPLEKQLSDSLLKRNTHPLARYVQEIPIYTGLESSGPLTELGKRQENESKIKSENIINGHILLSSKQNKPIEIITSNKTTGNGLSQLQRWLDNKETLNQALWGKGSLKEPFEFNSSNRIKFRRNESFDKNPGDTYLDQVYIRALEIRLIGIVNYIQNNPIYDPWKENWNALAKSMDKVNYSFSRLSESDADVAYTMNKGEATRFRIRDIDQRYVPMNIYQYVMLHEAAHCANKGKWGHGAEFRKLLSLLCLAAYELVFVDLKRMQDTVYTTNGQPVLSKGDMKKEILDGIDTILREHKDQDITKHYQLLAQHIRRIH